MGEPVTHFLCDSSNICLSVGKSAVGRVPRSLPFPYGRAMRSNGTHKQGDRSAQLSLMFRARVNHVCTLSEYK